MHDHAIDDTALSSRHIHLVMIALMTGAAMWFVTGAGAQGGGTIEADVKYNGAPQVEKLKVNKDTEKCGTEAVIAKVVVGGNKGRANAVVSVPGAKGATKASYRTDAPKDATAPKTKSGDDTTKKDDPAMAGE